MKTKILLLSLAWVAGENLVVESMAENPAAMKIEFGTWRDVRRDNMFIDMNKRKLMLRADHVNMDENGIVWFHRNADYPSVIAGELKAQPWAVGEISINMIKGTVRFFDSYYRKATKRLTRKELGPDGKLTIYPANSIVWLIGARNPIEVVAGLPRICGALPDQAMSNRIDGIDITDLFIRPPSTPQPISHA